MAKVKMDYQELIKLGSSINNIEALAKNIPGEAWLSISETKYKIEPHFKSVIEARDKVLEKYVVKNGAGWKMDESGGGFEYKSDEAKKKYDAEMTPLLEKSIEVQVEKIERSKLNKAVFDGVPNITAFFHHCVK